MTPEPKAPASDLDAAVGPWRCFHCDEVCETPEEAEHHFGRMDGCAPICRVAAETYRSMEREVQSYRSESDADTVTFYSLGAKHATALREAEQAGYDRGLADGRASQSQAAEGMAKALEPFSGWANQYCDGIRGDLALSDVALIKTELTIGDCREARTALSHYRTLGDRHVD